jgi:glycogen synthase
MSPELRFAIVSREVYPFGGGGMGNYVTWTAELLAEVGEVTIVTTDLHRPTFDELTKAGDPQLPRGVRIEFIPEPENTEDGIGTYYGFFHLWSALAFEALCRLYPDGGPDLVEFADYHGEGFVTVQAARTLDPRVRNTSVCVRMNTSSEMCQVLDGHLDRDLRVMLELERYSLRFADHIIWPGGDVLDTYRRFYGADAIGPPARIRHAVSVDGGTAQPSRGGDGPAPDGGPLRLLFLGRMERRKGVHNLLRALLPAERDDWTLTLVGGDTKTGPLGASVRGQLELMAGGDPRVEFRDRVPHFEIPELVRSHHLTVVPSLWECWPNVVLESLLQGRPVLGTPT